MPQKTGLEKLRFNLDDSIKYTVVACFFLGILMFSFILGWQNIILYIACILGSGALILKIPKSGLFTVVFMTMVFERYFTLEPLSLGGFVFKIYPLDIIILFTFLGALRIVRLKKKDVSLNSSRGSSALRPFDSAHGKLAQYDISENDSFKFSLLGVWIFLFMIFSFLFFMRSSSGGGVDIAVAFSTFKNYAFYALLYFIFTLLIKTKKDFDNLIKVFLGGSLIILIFLVIGIILGTGVWTEFTPLSTEGTRYLSFPHAFYLSLTFVFGVPLLYSSVQKVFLKIAALWGYSLGILFSLMRHLWLSVIAGFCFVLFILYRSDKKGVRFFLGKNWGAMLILVSSLLMIFWFFPQWKGTRQVKDLSYPLVSRIMSASDPFRDESLVWRVSAWKAVEVSFINSPWLGIGYGKNLVVNVDRFQDVFSIRDLHNSLFVLLVQTGIIGFSFFVAICYILILYLVRILKSNSDYFLYGVGVAGMLIVFLTASFWQPYFETNLTGIFFWIILGIVQFMYDQSMVDKK